MKIRGKNSVFVSFTLKRHSIVSLHWLDGSFKTQWPFEFLQTLFKQMNLSFWKRLLLTVTRLLASIYPFDHCLLPVTILFTQLVTIRLKNKKMTLF